MKKNKAVIVTMIRFLDRMARERFSKEETLTSEKRGTCERKGKDNSRFLACIKGRMIVPFTEMRKTKGGGDLGGKNQEFWLGLRSHLGTLKWLLG